MKTQTQDSTLFIDGSNLFYQHDSGVVFVTNMREIQTASENEQPFAVRMVTGLPLDSTDYSPDQDGPEGRLVFEWVDCMDEHLECIARAVSMSQHAAAVVHSHRLSVATGG